jgi:hypothetical protein
MTNYIKVPITYAPKDKMLARIEQDPNIDRPTAVVTLPMMSFEMAGFHYDGSRKLATVGNLHIAIMTIQTSSDINIILYHMILISSYTSMSRMQKMVLRL